MQEEPGGLQSMGLQRVGHDWAHSTPVEIWFWAKICKQNSNKYDYNATTGVLTIYGDDSVVKEYKADFTAVMKSRICARPDGSQEDAAYVAHNVHFQVSVVME